MYVLENKQDFEILKLQDDLEMQYGPAVAQNIADWMRTKRAIARTPEKTAPSLPLVKGVCCLHFVKPCTDFNTANDNGR